jgi:hypothetical protein
MPLRPLRLFPAALILIASTGAQADLCASPTVYTATMCSEVTMTISQTSSAVFAANMSSAAMSDPVQANTPSNLAPASRGQKNMLYFGKWYHKATLVQ